SLDGKDRLTNEVRQREEVLPRRRGDIPSIGVDIRSRTVGDPQLRGVCRHRLSLGRDVLRRTLDEGVDKIFRNQRDVAVFGLAPALGDLRSRHHSMESPRRGYGPPDLLRSGLLTRVRES